jgi:hypothetical protein
LGHVSKEGMSLRTSFVRSLRMERQTQAMTGRRSHDTVLEMIFDHRILGILETLGSVRMRRWRCGPRRRGRQK